MEDSELPTPTHTQHLLTPLRESIVDKPPYISGTLRLPNSCFSLFYKKKKDGNDTRHINLANATHDELEQLTQACDLGSLGLKEKEVSDETYCKAGEMDPDRFASPLHPSQTDLIMIIRGCLLEGTQASEYVVAELHKLNVYNKGSFFKPHVDTPRNQKMFGSLVIVFPTPHEGGALLLRYCGHEWVVESGQGLAAAHEPFISYVAFLSDIEHEVAQVTSGHRVTLTYNLYFDDGGRTVSSGGAAKEYLSLSPAVNENAFRETFQALLENPEFLPDGGTLAFGMRHVYPIPDATIHPNPLGPICSTLKGSDAVVYQTAHGLGFQPVLYMHYRGRDNPETAVSEKVINFGIGYGPRGKHADVVSMVLDRGGVVVRRKGWGSDYMDSELEHVEWVTPVTALNHKTIPYAAYRNEPALELASSDLCMFVRIGAAGERLVYPSLSQLREKWEKAAL